MALEAAEVPDRPVLPAVDPFWSSDRAGAESAATQPGWHMTITGDRSVRVDGTDLELDDGMVAVLGVFMAQQGRQVLDADLATRLPGVANPGLAAMLLYTRLDIGGQPVVSLHDPRSGSLARARWGLDPRLRIIDGRLPEADTVRPPRYKDDSDIRTWFSDPDKAITLERTLELLSPLERKYIRLRYGTLANHNRGRSTASIARQRDLDSSDVATILTSARAKVRELLPQVVAGTFDIAEWQKTQGRTRSVLGMLALAGITIPADSTMVELRQLAARTVDTATSLSDIDKRALRAHYKLAAPPELGSDRPARVRWVGGRLAVASRSALHRLSLEHGVHRPEADGRTSASMRRHIETGARRLDIDAWLTRPELRIATGRALATIGPKFAEALALHYGVHDGQPKPAAEVGRLMALSPVVVRTMLSRGRASLLDVLPSIAAGTYDFASHVNTGSRPRNVIHFLVKAGVDVPGDVSLEHLHDMGEQLLARMDGLDADDAMLLRTAFGIGEPIGFKGRPRLGKDFGLEPHQVKVALNRLMERVRRTVSGERAAPGRTAPTVSAVTLRRLGCYPVSEPDLAKLRQVKDPDPDTLTIANEDDYRRNSAHSFDEIAALAAGLSRRERSDERWARGTPGCSEVEDDSIFFPISEKDPDVAAAKAVCAACPVLDACLDDTLARPDRHAIRAGIAPWEHHKVVAARRILARTVSVS